MFPLDKLTVGWLIQQWYLVIQEVIGCPDYNIWNEITEQDLQAGVNFARLQHYFNKQ